MNRLVRSSTEGVVREGSGKASGTDPGQLISRIPAIDRCAAGIGHRLEIAVKVVGETVGSKGGLLIVDVVARGGERRWDCASRKGPALLDPIPRRIVRIGQIANDRRALLIREADEFRRGAAGLGENRVRELLLAASAM